MKFLSAATFVLGTAALAATAQAGTLKVPSEAYPTIQSAVDDAAPGDVIVVGPGTYSSTVNVTGTTDLQIRGKGWPLLLPASGPGFDIYGANDGLVISGFAVSGAVYGVSVSGGTSIRLEKLRIAACTTSGIVLEDSDHPVVSKCTIDVSTSHGLEDFGSLGLLIEKCRVSGSGGDSIRLSPTEGGALGSNLAIVTKNRVTGGVGGIRFAGNEAEISKNRVEGWTDTGIEIVGGTSSHNTIVTKNRVSGQGAVGIKVSTPDVIVSRNVLLAAAIYFDGDNQTCDRNVVTGALWAVYMSGNLCTITYNRARNLGSFGIRCNGDGCDVAENVLAGIDGNGIEIGGNNNNVAVNKVAGAAEAGFNVTGALNLFTTNSAKGSGGFGLLDTNDYGNIYEGNRFGTVSIGP